MNGDAATRDRLTGDAVLTELKARRRPIVFIISGPSGVGKDAIAERLQKSGAKDVQPDEGDKGNDKGIEGIKVVVTATTRPQRSGEFDMIHYEFLDKATFTKRMDEGYFIENATVYGPGNYYGVPRRQIQAAIDAGLDPVIKVDVQGAATIKQMIPQAVAIFVAPESIDALHERLLMRNTEDFDAANRRLRTARRELERVSGFDYIVFNESGELDRTVEQIKAIITAERLRTHPAPLPRLDPIV